MTRITKRWSATSSLSNCDSRASTSFSDGFEHSTRPTQSRLEWSMHQLMVSNGYPAGYVPDAAPEYFGGLRERPVQWMRASVAGLPILAYALAVDRARRGFVQGRDTFRDHQPDCQRRKPRSRSSAAIRNEVRSPLAQRGIASGYPHDGDLDRPPTRVVKGLRP
jgi:hypothetical protein